MTTQTKPKKLINNKTLKRDLLNVIRLILKMLSNKLQLSLGTTLLCSIVDYEYNPRKSCLEYILIIWEEINFEASNVNRRCCVVFVVCNKYSVLLLTIIFCNLFQI